MPTKPYALLIGFIGLLSFFVPPKSSVQLTPLQWLFGTAIGALFAYGIYITLRAYEKEEVSRLASLGILSTILITAGSAVFFGDSLTKTQYTAFFVFLVGSLLLATRVKLSIEVRDFSKLGAFLKQQPKKTLLRTLEELAADPTVHWVRFRKKIKINQRSWLVPRFCASLHPLHAAR